MPPRKRVYYSHPIIFYFKPIEKKALEIIKSKFKNIKIVNPRDFPFLGMENYCDIVKECDILVAQPLSEKVFSCGVFDEINTALKSNVPVFCLDINTEKIFRIDSLYGFKCLNREETIRAFHNSKLSAEK